jgi:hypothetical protein
MMLGQPGEARACSTPKIDDITTQPAISLREIDNLMGHRLRIEVHSGQIVNRRKRSVIGWHTSLQKEYFYRWVGIQ